MCLVCDCNLSICANSTTRDERSLGNSPVGLPSKIQEQSVTPTGVQSFQEDNFFDMPDTEFVSSTGVTPTESVINEQAKEDEGDQVLLLEVGSSAAADCVEDQSSCSTSSLEILSDITDIEADVVDDKLQWD